MSQDKTSGSYLPVSVPIVRRLEADELSIASNASHHTADGEFNSNIAGPSVNDSFTDYQGSYGNSLTSRIYSPAQLGQEKAQFVSLAKSKLEEMGKKLRNLPQPIQKSSGAVYGLQYTDESLLKLRNEEYNKAMNRVNANIDTNDMNMSSIDAFDIGERNLWSARPTTFRSTMNPPKNSVNNNVDNNVNNSVIIKMNGEASIGTAQELAGMIYGVASPSFEPRPFVDDVHNSNSIDPKTLPKQDQDQENIDFDTADDEVMSINSNKMTNDSLLNNGKGSNGTMLKPMINVEGGHDHSQWLDDDTLCPGRTMSPEIMRLLDSHPDYLTMIEMHRRVTFLTHQKYLQDERLKNYKPETPLPTEEEISLLSQAAEEAEAAMKIEQENQKKKIIEDERLAEEALKTEVEEIEDGVVMDESEIDDDEIQESGFYRDEEDASDHRHHYKAVSSTHKVGLREQLKSLSNYVSGHTHRKMLESWNHIEHRFEDSNLHYIEQKKDENTGNKISIKHKALLLSELSQVLCSTSVRVNHKELTNMYNSLSIDKDQQYLSRRIAALRTVSQLLSGSKSRIKRQVDLELQVLLRETESLISIHEIKELIFPHNKKELARWLKKIKMTKQKMIKEMMEEKRKKLERQERAERRMKKAVNDFERALAEIQYSKGPLSVKRHHGLKSTLEYCVMRIKEAQVEKEITISSDILNLLGEDVFPTYVKTSDDRNIGSSSMDSPLAKTRKKLIVSPSKQKSAVLPVRFGGYGYFRIQIGSNGFNAIASLRLVVSYGRGLNGYSYRDIVEMLQAYATTRIQSFFRGYTKRYRYQFAKKIWRRIHMLIKVSHFGAWRDYTRYQWRLRRECFRKIKGWKFYVKVTKRRKAVFSSCFWPFYVWRRDVNERCTAREKALFLVTRVLPTYVQLRNFRAWKKFVQKKVNDLRKASDYLQETLWKHGISMFYFLLRWTQRRKGIRRSWLKEGSLMQKKKEHEMKNTWFLCWRAYHFYSREVKVRVQSEAAIFRNGSLGSLCNLGYKKCLTTGERRAFVKASSAAQNAEDEARNRMGNMLGQTIEEKREASRLKKERKEANARRLEKQYGGGTKSADEYLNPFRWSLPRLIYQINFDDHEDLPQLLTDIYEEHITPLTVPLQMHFMHYASISTRSKCDVLRLRFQRTLKWALLENSFRFHRLAHRALSHLKVFAKIRKNARKYREMKRHNKLVEVFIAFLKWMNRGDVSAPISMDAGELTTAEALKNDLRISRLEKSRRRQRVNYMMKVHGMDPSSPRSKPIPAPLPAPAESISHHGKHKHHKHKHHKHGHHGHGHGHHSKHGHGHGHHSKGHGHGYGHGHGHHSKGHGHGHGHHSKGHGHGDGHGHGHHSKGHGHGHGDGHHAKKSSHSHHGHHAKAHGDTDDHSQSVENNSISSRGNMGDGSLAESTSQSVNSIDANDIHSVSASSHVSGDSRSSINVNNVSTITTSNTIDIDIGEEREDIIAGKQVGSRATGRKEGSAMRQRKAMMSKPEGVTASNPKTNLIVSTTTTAGQNNINSTSLSVLTTGTEGGPLGPAHLSASSHLSKYDTYNDEGDYVPPNVYDWDEEDRRNELESASRLMQVSNDLNKEAEQILSIANEESNRFQSMKTLKEGIRDQYLDKEGNVTENAIDSEINYADNFKIHAAGAMVDTVSRIYEDVSEMLLRRAVRKYFRSMRIPWLEVVSVNLRNRKRLANWIRLCMRLKACYERMPFYRQSRTKWIIFNRWLKLVERNRTTCTYGLVRELKARREHFTAYHDFVTRPIMSSHGSRPSTTKFEPYDDSRPTTRDSNYMNKYDLPSDIGPFDLGYDGDMLPSRPDTGYSVKSMGSMATRGLEKSVYIDNKRVNKLITTPRCIFHRWRTAATEQILFRKLFELSCDLCRFRILQKCFWCLRRPMTKGVIGEVMAKETSPSLHRTLADLEQISKRFNSIRRRLTPYVVAKFNRKYIYRYRKEALKIPRFKDFMIELKEGTKTRLLSEQRMLVTAFEKRGELDCVDLIAPSDPNDVGISIIMINADGTKISDPPLPALCPKDENATEVPPGFMITKVRLVIQQKMGIVGWQLTWSADRLSNIGGKRRGKWIGAQMHFEEIDIPPQDFIVGVDYIYEGSSILAMRFRYFHSGMSSYYGLKASKTSLSMSLNVDHSAYQDFEKNYRTTNLDEELNRALPRAYVIGLFAHENVSRLSNFQLVVRKVKHQDIFSYTWVNDGLKRLRERQAEEAAELERLEVERLQELASQMGSQSRTSLSKASISQSPSILQNNGSTTNANGGNDVSGADDNASLPPISTMSEGSNLTKDKDDDDDKSKNTKVSHANSDDNSDVDSTTLPGDDDEEEEEPFKFAEEVPLKDATPNEEEFFDVIRMRVAEVQSAVIRAENFARHVFKAPHLRHESHPCANLTSVRIISKICKWLFRSLSKRLVPYPVAEHDANEKLHQSRIKSLKAEICDRRTVGLREMADNFEKGPHPWTGVRMMGPELKKQRQAHIDKIRAFRKEARDLDIEAIMLRKESEKDNNEGFLMMPRLPQSLYVLGNYRNKVLAARHKQSLLSSMSLETVKNALADKAVVGGMSSSDMDLIRASLLEKKKWDTSEHHLDYVTELAVKAEANRISQIEAKLDRLERDQLNADSGSRLMGTMEDRAANKGIGKSFRRKRAVDPPLQRIKLPGQSRSVTSLYNTLKPLPSSPLSKQLKPLTMSHDGVITQVIKSKSAMPLVWGDHDEDKNYFGSRGDLDVDYRTSSASLGIPGMSVSHSLDASLPSAPLSLPGWADEDPIIFSSELDVNGINQKHSTKDLLTSSINDKGVKNEMGVSSRVRANNDQDEVQESGSVMQSLVNSISSQFSGLNQSSLQISVPQLVELQPNQADVMDMTHDTINSS